MWVGQACRNPHHGILSAAGHRQTFSCTQVTCKAGGKPGDVLSVGTEPLPLALGWGEVLVNIRAAPVRCHVSRGVDPLSHFKP
jgi:hypothetical protein